MGSNPTGGAVARGEGSYVFITSRVGRLVAAVGTVGALTGGLIAISASPALAAGSLTNVSWTVSNNTTNVDAAGNTATYTWNFTTATTASLATVTMTVPTGTTGASLAVTAYGIGSDTATASLSGTTVTVTLTGGASIAAGTAVSMAVSGFTNGTQTGSVTSTIQTAASSTIDNGQASATFANNTTSVSVVVPDSLTFTNNKTSVTLTPVPNTPAVEGPNPATLTVATNAQNGYTLSACAGSLAGPGSNTIPQQQSSVASLTGSAFGAQASVTGSAGASIASPWSGTNFIGYAATCSNTATGGGAPSSPVVTNTGPTNLDTVQIANAASVSATQAAGTYTGTINYLVTPSY